MAKKKLNKVNIIGDLYDINHFATEIHSLDDLQVLDVVNEIESGIFRIPVTEKSIEEILNLNNLKQYTKKELKQEEIETLIKEFEEYYKDSLEFKQEYSKRDEFKTPKIIKESEDLLAHLQNKKKQLMFKEKTKEDILKSIEAYSYLENYDVSMSELNDLKYFSYQIGSLNKYNAQRLKIIYPSIPALVFHIGSAKDNREVYLIFSRDTFQPETERILRVLDFKKVEGFDPAYYGTPRLIIKRLKDKLSSVENEISKLEADISSYIETTKGQASILYSQLRVLLEVINIKTLMGYSDRQFYFSAIIPEKILEPFKEKLKLFPHYDVIFVKPEILHVSDVEEDNSPFKQFKQLLKRFV